MSGLGPVAGDVVVGVDTLQQAMPHRKLLLCRQLKQNTATGVGHRFRILATQPVATAL